MSHGLITFLFFIAWGVTLGMQGEMELSTKRKSAYEVKFVLYFDAWPNDPTTQHKLSGVNALIEKSSQLTQSELQALENKINNATNIDHFQSGTMHSIYSAARIFASNTGLHQEGWPYRLSSPRTGKHRNTAPVAFTFKPTKNYLV